MNPQGKDEDEVLTGVRRRVERERRWKREGVPKAAKQVAVGALVAGVVLLVGGAVGTGRGPVAYLEFQQKMSGVVGQAGVNKLGASALATELVHRATTREVTRPDGRTVKVREYAPIRTGAVVTARWLLLAAGLFAFWRALSRVTAAEAAVLSFALVPLLTSPANYYYVLVLCAAMLVPRRPWIGIALALTTLAWIAVAHVWFLQDMRYVGWDVVILVFSLVVLFGVAFSSPPESATEATTPA